MSQKISASIVIPVKNDSRIRRCVLSLLDQTVSRDCYEIIVVDNNSTKVNIPDILSDLPVKIYRENKLGLAAATNYGLLKAQGDFLVRIDADCIAEKSWLEELLLPFKEANIGAVGGLILKETGNNLVEKAARGLVIGDQLEPQYLPMYNAPYVVTANAAYRLRVVKEIGGFDNDFISGSDVDISWRIHIAGYYICTTNKAIVDHPSRPTIRKYFYQFYNYGLGHALLFKKYKKITGKKTLINVYPFVGIFRVISRDIPKALYLLVNKKEDLQIYATRMFLDLTEYIALICGDLVGAFKHKILYF